MRESYSTASPAARLLSFAILLAPALVLGALAARYNSRLLAAGAAAEFLGLLLFVRGGVVWKPPASGSVILLYLMGLGWCWFHTKNLNEPPAAFARGVLLLGAVGLVFVHDLQRTGAEARRRAKRLCARIRHRRQWPADPAVMHRVPEVVALRDAVARDASPIFGLFNDARPEVRMAAFAALENRAVWRPAEIAVVLHKAHQMADANVRAVAVTALSSVTDAPTVMEVAHFLRDPDGHVRLAAVRGVLGHAGQRWVFVREHLRGYLADGRFAADGGLPGSAGKLPAVAICDLTAWANEPDYLGHRSVRTLVEHYAAALRSAIDYDLVCDLSQQVIDPHTPAGLRVELAHLLRSYNLLTADLLDRMTNSDQPGPIRLLGAEAMLIVNPSDPDALDVLRGLGRQPNREIALAVAKVLQQHLGFDMGLSGDRVAVTSKTAGEVVKKVFQWATARSMNSSSNPTPGLPSPGLPETPPPLGMTKTGPPVGRGSVAKPW